MRRGSALLLLCAVALGMTAPVAVAGARKPTAYRFHMPAQPLSQALNQLAVRSDREILFSPALTRARLSPPLIGVFTPEEALRRLLAGSGLTVRTEGRSFLIVPGPRPAPSVEESAPATPSPATAPLDVVVVTALRRSSLAQQTPISMVVVSGEALSRMGMLDLEKAAPLLPGLRLVSTAFGRRLVLRGVYGAGEATTGLYYDETSMTGPVGTTADPGVMIPELALADVDRIELLRGPQGTLYGSGAMGGALRILFKHPDLEESSAVVGASVTSAAHGGRAGGVTGTLNAVVVPEVLGVRLTAYDQRQPGVIDNVRLGLSDVDASNVQGGRALVLWSPSERFSALFSGTHQKSHRDDIPAWNDVAGAWRTVHAGRAPFDGQIDLASSTLRWRGYGAEVTAAASWYRWRLTRRSDYSGVLLGERESVTGCMRYFSLTSACDAAQAQGYGAYVDSVYPAILNQPANLTARIQEVRAASTGEGAFSWTVGVYNEVRRDHIDSQVRHVDPATGALVEPAVMIGRRNIDNRLRQSAVFGEGSYAVGSATRLTIGGRRFDYVKRDSGQVQVPNVVSGTWAGYAIDKRTNERGWSLKALVSHDLSTNLFAYAQVSQGFRPGGVNVVPGLPDSLAAYRSDRLTNYELGLKTQAAGQRLTANVALYRIDWRDMQYAAQTQNRAFSYLTNIGASRILGLEAEIVARRLAGWDFAVGLNLTDAKLTADQVTNAAIGLGRAGDRLPTVPRLAASGGVERRWAVGALEANLRLDVSYAGTARAAFNPDNPDYLKMGGYAVFGVATGLRASAWSFDLSIDNILDRAGRASAARNTSGPIEYFGVAPRTLRLQVERRF